MRFVFKCLRRHEVNCSWCFSKIIFGFCVINIYYFSHAQVSNFRDRKYRQVLQQNIVGRKVTMNYRRITRVKIAQAFRYIA